MLEFFKSRVSGGHENSQAKMLLSIAEVNSDKRGRKNRALAQEAATQALEMFRTVVDHKMQAATLHVLSEIIMRDKKASKEAKSKEAQKYAMEAYQLYRKVR